MTTQHTDNTLPTVEQQRGTMLRVARTLWVLVTLLTLALFLLGTPSRFVQLASTTDWRSLASLGFSAGFYAGFLLALNYILVLTHIFLAGVIFVRRPDEWIALFVAFTLVANGALFPLSLMRAPVFLSQALWQSLVAIITTLGLSTSVVLLYFFPTGHFVPRWTRWLAILWLALILLALFLPQSLVSLSAWPRWLKILVVIFFSGSGIYAQIYRYENISSPVQRQQAKWALLGLVAAAFGPLVYFLSSAFSPASATPEVSNLLYQRVGGSYFSFSVIARMAGAALLTAYLMLFPLTFAIAILRYRLWDIDILIRRTIAYTALTATLILIYFFTVLVLQRVFISITGESRSGTVTIVSTLSIAALFNPLRRRIQNSIDRRFYRQKYDAEKTLAAFSASLRDEVDLDALCDRLMAVVDNTLQPEHTLLWLKPASTSLPSDQPAYEEHN
ncbi:MAG: hypothetical protein A2W36_02350 [Chloroflexi bacterium RBG_16_58_14]|nr:MAG: hypothetical protein A2W36_02350 [Chloroflexi bacterium RBG_16_58_14]